MANTNTRTPAQGSIGRQFQDLLGAAVYRSGAPVVIATHHGLVECRRHQPDPPEDLRPADPPRDERSRPGPRTVSPDRGLLTPRERECLVLVAARHTGAEIARQLGLAPNTVAQHLVAVRRKYGVSTSQLAATLAEADGEI